MIATKIWGEMTLKVGVSPSSAPLRKSCVGGNSQLGASSIGSQAGSRSPPDPRRESDVRFDFYSLLVFFIQFFHLLPCAAARLPRPERKTFACYFRRILCVLCIRAVGDTVYPSPQCVSLPPPTFLRDLLALHYIPIKHPPLPLPQHKCTGSAPN